MLRIEYAYWLLAAFLAAAAWINLRERRIAAAAFWAVLALLFGGGDGVLKASATGNPLPAQIAGVGVLLLAVLAPRMRRVQVEEVSPEMRLSSAMRLGHRLFLPALLIPGVTVLVAVLGGYMVVDGHRLFAVNQMTLTGLALASLLAVLAALRLTQAPALAAVREGRRLLDTLGWAALLPLVLAALGGVFTQSGVGQDIAHGVGMVIPTDSRLACVLAYGFGMVVFTVIMGNAFAAFPVITAGIGLPLLIELHGASPAIVGALGMLCGYCGTLLTPMAANFNIVPVALLELDSPYAVIRAQWPTALLLLAFNLVLMSALAFR
ncbi:MAG TPA: DUF979 family protein [Rhodanobacteraceae bacterium]|nr:DUF979 family protein [Rhodanobacteraceae bacterium]